MRSTDLHSHISTSKLRSDASKVHSAYLLVGLRNQAREASVSVQEVLELQVADKEPLRLSQGFFSRVLAVNQQTLEHLQTQPERHAKEPRTDIRATHPCVHLPADRVQHFDVVPHVLVHVERVDHRVDFERHFVGRAPVVDLVKVIDVALLALNSADQLVGVLVETVAGDGQDVQIVT